MASSSFVLLENDGTLPLKADGRYSLIGSLAHEPRYQGAGSSKINPTKLDRIDEALTARGVQYSYAPGYDVHSSGTDEDLIREAKAVASASDVVILVLGLPSGYESEGFDRSQLDLPEGQLRLLDALKEVGRPLVVLIEAGGPVLLPFRKEVSSLLFCYLGGQALGTALADVIFGDLSPSGHLVRPSPPPR